MTDPLLDTAPMRPVRPGRRRSSRGRSDAPGAGLTIGAALGLWVTSFVVGSAIGALTRDDDRTGAVVPPEPASADVAPPDDGGPGAVAGVSAEAADQPDGGAGGGSAAVPVATSTPTAAQPQPPSPGHGRGNGRGNGNGNGQETGPPDDDGSGPGNGRGRGGGESGEGSPPATDPSETTTTTAPPTTAPPTTAPTTTTPPAGPGNGDAISITPFPG